jgi:hypothetical protein
LAAVIGGDGGVEKMFLREYVYVDIDRVGGLAAQLYDGVPEKATNIVARQKRLEVDLKLLKGGGESSREEQTERNLADSLFKDLETDLEALGLLRDLSEELASLESWDDIESLVSAGQILRITAPGTLFHPAQMSDAIVGMATAAVGLSDLGIGEDEILPSSPVPPKAKTETQKRAERSARQTPAGEPRYPEDYLPSVLTVPLMNLDRKFLAGLIKVTRGVFSEGVHLQLRPTGVDGPAITARLEAGRRFLDSSPEVLFSRYGLGPQEWTAVGVVGQLGSRISPGEVDDVTNADGSVNRARFVDLVRHFLATTAGFVDLPMAPGFSLIPLAVYRGIGDGMAVER